MLKKKSAQNFCGAKSTDSSKKGWAELRQFPHHHISSDEKTENGCKEEKSL